jgi:hypothetical protein
MNANRPPRPTASAPSTVRRSPPCSTVVTAHPGFGRLGRRFCGELSDCKRMIDMVTGDSIQTSGAPTPDLSQLSHAEKDALIVALWQRLEAAERRIAELRGKALRSAEDPRQFRRAAAGSHGHIFGPPKPL